MIQFGRTIIFAALAVSATGAPHVVINEIHYDPKDKQPHEFVELHNAGDAPAKLDGWRLDKFPLPAGTEVPPGGFVIIAANPPALEKEFSVKSLGPFTGKLSNEGERLTLFDAAGKVVDKVEYGAGFPWPSASAGRGSSLEKINPTADPARPGHWRASGFSDAPPVKVGIFIAAGSAGWRWRKDEMTGWTATEFNDAAWTTGRAGFGYGDEDDATVVPQCRSLFLRHAFTVEKVPEAIVLRVRVDDGCVAWLNGHEIARFHVPAGVLGPQSLAEDHEAGEWEEVRIENAARFLRLGKNLLAVRAINSSPDSSDLSCDAMLVLPGVGGSSAGKKPTPGAPNSVLSAAAPPACGWVQHSPEQPRTGEPLIISAALTDREGVRSAVLHVQLVEPGAYVRRSDADYETRWVDFPMHDDGRDGDTLPRDNVWSARLPDVTAVNRRLVRYRITATGGDGAVVRLPYADDPCPNFACFVWNGPLAWAAASQPGKTPPVTFSPELQKSLPIFTLIADAKDVRLSQYEGGYNHKRFTGTFVHQGRVFDHMEFHNRGSASTYVCGKNKWGFHFLPAHELKLRDQWGRKRKESWNSFAMNACASPWVQENRGMAGLDEVVSFRAYQLAGVPASDAQPVHFRVVASASETGKTQYDSDLWGLYTAVEDSDGAWLKNHDFPVGPVFSEHGNEYTPSGYTGDAGREWEEFRAGPRGDAEKWWRANMDMQGYYSFHAINRLVANIDLRPGANHSFYKNPERGWAPVPWDLDMQFLPRVHQPGYIDQIRCLDVRALKTEFRNRAREILDLLASDARPEGGQIGQLVAEYARLIENEHGSWAQLDQHRWNHAPATADKGAFYRPPRPADFAAFSKYVVDFCTDSRPKKDYAINDQKPLGYGWGYLSIEAADKDIPARPTLRYTGPVGYPAGALGFESTPFHDPQGDGTFGAMQWRIGEIGRPADKPWRYEIEPVWQSAELPSFVPQVHIPQGTCKPGRTYRARVRHRDDTGRWSHWSEAVKFTAGR